MDILKKMLEERNAQAIADKQAKIQDAVNFSNNMIQNTDEGMSADNYPFRENLAKSRDMLTSKYKDLKDLDAINADVGMLPEVNKPTGNDVTDAYARINKNLKDDLWNSPSQRDENKRIYLEILKQKLGIE